MANPSVTKQETLCYKERPAGSEGKREQWDLRGKTEIAQIFISYGDGINSIQFQYVIHGCTTMSPIFGSSSFNGYSFQVIKLDNPTEYIIGIEGRFSSSCIEELEIITNKHSLGRLGRLESSSEMKQFKLQFGPDNQFGGFHGTHDSKFLTSIGVYFTPRIPINPTFKMLDIDDGY